MLHYRHSLLTLPNLLFSLQTLPSMRDGKVIATRFNFFHNYVEYTSKKNKIIIELQ